MKFSQASLLCFKTLVELTKNERFVHISSKIIFEKIRDKYGYFELEDFPKDRHDVDILLEPYLRTNFVEPVIIKEEDGRFFTGYRVC